MKSKPERIVGIVRVVGDGIDHVRDLCFQKGTAHVAELGTFRASKASHSAGRTLHELQTINSTPGTADTAPPTHRTRRSLKRLWLNPPGGLRRTHRGPLPRSARTVGARCRGPTRWLPRGLRSAAIAVRQCGPVGLLRACVKAACGDGRSRWQRAPASSRSSAGTPCNERCVRDRVGRASGRDARPLGAAARDWPATASHKAQATDLQIPASRSVVMGEGMDSLDSPSSHDYQSARRFGGACERLEFR